MADQIEYAQEALFSIPAAMGPWNMQLELPAASKFNPNPGEYVLVDCQQAGVELHHQVEVIDENGDPLGGVWVIFGFPGGGPGINLAPSQNYWPQAPAVLKGNAQRTPISGYVQHTFQQGGEDIWVWDLDADGVLKLPSPIVKNCTWVRTPVGHFEHTGVKLTFQRRMTGVIPREQRLRAIEQRVAAIAQQLGMS
jgi:hypothetical protein